MKYNSKLPITFIHIPKTGGTSVRAVFENWFGADHIIHCYNKDDIIQRQTQNINKSGVVLYGHFNRATPCIEQASQLITIMRNPLDCAISEYFHRKRTNRLIDGRDTLIKHLAFKKHNTLTDRVSFDINNKNYKKIIDTKFLSIGVAEKMHNTLENIANILNKPSVAAGSIPQLNVAPGYDDEINTLTDSHRKMHQDIYNLEYLIYEYVYNKL